MPLVADDNPVSGSAPIPDDDPVWQAIFSAEVDEGPIPEEEARAVEEGLASLARGEVVDGAEVTAQLALGPDVWPGGPGPR